MKSQPGVYSLDLERAISARDADALRAYLERGGDPNSRILSPETPPVAYAGRCGFTEGVNILIDAGSKLLAVDFWGDNALHQAASGAGPEVIKTLIEAGTPIDAKNKRGTTALMKAAGATFNPERSARYIAALECLLEQGANPRLTDKDGSNALFYAIQAGAQPGIDRLLAYTPATSARYQGRRTILHLAAQKGWAEKIAPFCALGVNLDARSREGYTALHVAVIQARKEQRASVAARLLDVGIDAKILDDEGKTAEDHASDKPDLLEVFAVHAARTRINSVLKQAKAGRDSCPR